MLEIFDVNYSLLANDVSEELFTLRKETFKDRLDWAVNCNNGMEFDEYDNNHTNYLLGVNDGSVICSVRFIETKYPNMITGTFFSYFDRIDIPSGNYLESSRFFVDKKRVKSMFDSRFPISSILFLAMINYSINAGYDGIFTIVSHPMLTILKRSGWGISVVEKGLSEKEKPIYLLFLPTDSQNQAVLIDRIKQHESLAENTLTHWPLSLAFTE
ncbi:acyl-homoserine-lactone synthase [Serratia sp. AKBS12]|uniref:acyl-homoserine-lactone synthase n=1 Tax=Serratia sp. AKBS12 TaxID=2974597 RepID=UPI0021661B1D|nr:acyl-homoserine-lactone synthase [Serratia sp. AKBS12]MCS3406342.1 acyl-homoserine-lactone synthase [Serratia sp. AKBS12]HEI8868614.1 acyl-homoserine-lactone synthase [Serratia odorifera]